jgi:3'-phosphoadenosine 5'-phosphosulfate sulfotransferase (PAPS reductase)/FAD synthetase
MNKTRYQTNDNAIVSFSGGRTSGYMLWRILDAYDGKLPDHIKVCFANTGKEMPETLDFVRDCSKAWGVEIVWLERFAQRNEGEGKMYLYATQTVTYETASRKGEPFASLIASRNYLPNPVARFCTQEMKIFAIRDFIALWAEDQAVTQFVGLRADEPRRAQKLINRGGDIALPLYRDGVTKQTVSDFWKSQPFDLNLPNNNGVTDWGNCDLCFLKGLDKKLSIIRERPDLADWWIDMEQTLSEKVGKPAFFRQDQPSYAQMKIIASSQHVMEMPYDETIPCFCGD